MIGLEESRRLRGRPRNREIGPTILAATRLLIIEHGYDGVTTQMIVDAVGAGKQTIYRRWSSKSELVLDAFLAHAEGEVDHLSERSLPIREQIAGFLRRTFFALAETAPAVRSLMATAQQDAAFRESFKSRFIEPRRSALRLLLRNAVEDGLLPQSADVETAVFALYGALWYRLLLFEALDDAYANRLATFCVAGLSP